MHSKVRILFLVSIDLKWATQFSCFDKQANCLIENKHERIFGHEIEYIGRVMPNMDESQIPRRNKKCHFVVPCVAFILLSNLFLFSSASHVKQLTGWDTLWCQVAFFKQKGVSRILGQENVFLQNAGAKRH